MRSAAEKKKPLTALTGPISNGPLESGQTRGAQCTVITVVVFKKRHLLVSRSCFDADARRVRGAVRGEGSGLRTGDPRFRSWRSTGIGWWSTPRGGPSFAMAFRRAVRWTASATFGLGALSGAQAFACHARYEALPDATGPTRGFATPNTIIHDVAEWRGKSAVGQSAMRLLALGDQANGRAPESEWIEAKTASTETSSKKKKRLLLHVIGDSLVTGAGVSRDADGFGPVLPRVIAERLATLLDADVEWHAFGKKAADVASIRKDVVGDWSARRRGLKSDAEERVRDDEGGRENNPPLPVPVPAAATAAAAPAPDIVIVLCGVNDLKHAFRGRTPDAFGRELRATLRDVRRAVSDENNATGKTTLVVLPGMPMHLVTAFPFPLSLVAVAAGEFWDDQKRKLARSDDRRDANRAIKTVYVPKPTRERMAIFGADAALIAKDGVHPNEWGYAAWAHHVAREIAALREGEAHPPETAR